MISSWENELLDYTFLRLVFLNHYFIPSIRMKTHLAVKSDHLSKNVLKWTADSNEKPKTGHVANRILGNRQRIHEFHRFFPFSV
ncbi:hypothetical protein DLM78_08930 [Leptospira stimsonii]|uniref:Uncharacterized protein n=1 Tax=Leptospira stimsonii TaxID=2202203 RepID=A0A8B6RYD2_9LEPT|nr:hypothetical protein DLM78_08930 [Leptospira stimsonii]